MSIQSNSPIRNTWRRRALVGIAAVLVAMLFISQTSVEVEPAPPREPKGTLKMGVVLSDLPYQDIDENGEAIGSEVEIFSKAARAMAIPVEYVGGTEESLLALLQSGEIDGIVGIPYQKGRNAAFYFYLRPYGSPRIAAIVPRSSPVERIWDLRGRDVLVRGGSEAESYVLGHGLTKNLGRKMDLDGCFEELSMGASYAAVICDEARAQSYLSGDSDRWKVVPGGQGSPRGAVLAAGFDAFATDLEEGLQLTSESSVGAVAEMTEVGAGGDNQKIQPALALDWLPYALAVLFAMGFLLVLVTNRRISRRAHFLITELEERIRAGEWAKRAALLDKGIGRRNRRSVIR